MPSFKQTFWKVWYQYITNRIGNDPVTFLNYGYWPPEGETLSLQTEDESNRPAIQLYHHVASGAYLMDKDVLEVSCGHGGGASFVKRYHLPIDKDIADAGFQIKSKSDITDHVLHALKITSKRHRELIHGFTPKILYPFMETFAAIEGSGVYNSFVNRERIYFSYCLMKT
ncbi:MAG TPA: hypothetical protein VJ785_12340 [Anaerolineales bacterium]|nr:hypothetical protein [Anaerolineales bacterium]